MLTEEQIAMRRHGITATDMATLSGVHPYRAPINVWLEKQGKAEIFQENERVKWGNLLEPLIRDDYARRHGLHVVEVGTMLHKSVPWAMATPDGIAYPSGLPGIHKPSHGLEIKTHNYRIGLSYGTPGTDQVPGYVLVQAVWNMFVTGLDRWDVVAFSDGLPRDYRIHRDEQLVTELIEIAQKFRRDHLIAQIPPEPDGSERYSSYLQRMVEQKKDSFVSLEDKPDFRKIVDDLRALKSTLKDCERREEKLTQELKVVCGEFSGLEWSEVVDGKKTIQRITWKKSKDSSRTDWEAVANVLVEQIKTAIAGPPLEGMSLLAKVSDLDAVAAPHTSSRPGSRVFVTPKNWSKNDE
jgi:putative phage-type endonuclease